MFTLDQREEIKFFLHQLNYAYIHLEMTTYHTFLPHSLPSLVGNCH